MKLRISELKRDPDRLNTLRRRQARQIRREIELLEPNDSETVNSILYKCSGAVNQTKKRMERKIRYYEVAIFRSEFVGDLAKAVADRTSEDRWDMARRIMRAMPFSLAKTIKHAFSVDTEEGPGILIPKGVFEGIVRSFVGQTEEGDWDLEFPTKYLKEEK